MQKIPFLLVLMFFCTRQVSCWYSLVPSWAKRPVEATNLVVEIPLLVTKALPEDTPNTIDAMLETLNQPSVKTILTLFWSGALSPVLIPATPSW